MPVVQIARHAAHPDHQAFFQCGVNADLHDKLVGRPGLAFGNALDPVLAVILR